MHQSWRSFTPLVKEHSLPTPAIMPSAGPPAVPGLGPRMHVFDALDLSHLCNQTPALGLSTPRPRLWESTEARAHVAHPRDGSDPSVHTLSVCASVRKFAQINTTGVPLGRSTGSQPINVREHSLSVRGRLAGVRGLGPGSLGG